MWPWKQQRHLLSQKMKKKSKNPVGRNNERVESGSMGKV